jgi:hypothetical protein
MKLARYISNGTQTYGVIKDEKAISLLDLADNLTRQYPPPSNNS